MLVSTNLGHFMVSMPFNGLHPFLQVAVWIWKTCKKYQCPLTGFIHFYHPLRSEFAEFCMCQCPLTGLSHFYISKFWWRMYCYCVSMPFNGLTQFLPSYQWPSSFFSTFGVNALQWAIPISTLPFWKPLFIRVWRVRFPQDFLNCYKSVILFLFFGFSKILLLTCILFYHIFMANARTF